MSCASLVNAALRSSTAYRRKARDGENVGYAHLTEGTVTQVRKFKVVEWRLHGGQSRQVFAFVVLFEHPDSPVHALLIAGLLECLVLENACCCDMGHGARLGHC